MASRCLGSANPVEIESLNLHFMICRLPAERKGEKYDVRALDYVWTLPGQCCPSASENISNTSGARWAPVPGASIYRQMVELESRGRRSSRR